MTRTSKSTLKAPPQESMSPMVKQLYNGQWPPREDLDKFGDELLYLRAVDSYMFSLAALNVIGMRDGSEAQFGVGYHVLPVWKDRMNAKVWVPTPNCDVVYSMNYLDLKKTGPLVVYAPPGVIGMFYDFFQRALTDVGAAGPDQGKGGLYLLLPPDYQGIVPAGYWAFRSSTYNVMLFFRTVPTQGADGPDTTQATATAEQTRIYPWGMPEKERPAMQFPNASDLALRMMYPTDFSYWEKLKAFIDYEPVECLTPEVRGFLAAIGIIKGVPFTPDKRTRQALTRALEAGPKMIFAARISGRADGGHLYYKNRQWFNIWAGANELWLHPTYLDIDTRAGFFQCAYSSAPAMVVDTINQGSKYPAAIRDSKGELLNGSNSYKLHLPKGIPAMLFWAVTIYNPADGTMPLTGQPFPGLGQRNNPPVNADGSVDIYFGPTKPKDVDEKSWIQTLPGKAILVGLRLYGSASAFFDQTWIPGDLEKMK